MSSFFQIILLKSHPYADLACGVLANMTRHTNNVETILSTLEPVLEKLISTFCDLEYNSKKCTLDLLGSCIANLTQANKGRM